MAHDSSRQQAMVTDVPVATVVNGEQLMPLVLVHERALAVWVIVDPAADAALGATNVPAAAANAATDAQANLAGVGVFLVGLLIRCGVAGCGSLPNRSSPTRVAMAG